MQYTIHANQKVLLKIAPELDISHYAIIDYLKKLCLSNSEKIKKKRHVDDDGNVWTWVDLSTVIKQLPCLKINTKSTISKRIQDVIKSGLFDGKRKNQRLYIKPSRLLDELEFDPPFDKTNTTVRTNERTRSYKRTNYNTNDYSIKDSKSEYELSKSRMGGIEQEILDFWNSHDIVVHKKLYDDAQKEIRAIFGYPNDRTETPDEVLSDAKKGIELYATVLQGDEYWWSHKWNLYEFLKRGFKQFQGKTADDYLNRKKSEEVDKF